MNYYGIIVLIALVGEYVIDLTADLLNLKTLRGELDDEFRSVYDNQTYSKSLSYTRDKTNFGIIQSSFNLVITLLFWLLGGFQYLDVIIRDFQLSIIMTGILYIGVFILLRSILSLPFEIYSTFIIESRYGFNKTTVKTFITDIIKTLFLALLLGVPLLFGMLSLFQYAGMYAWLYCWMAVSVFILIVQFIAPTWIMPLFNKFTPLPDGELRSSIMEYTKSLNYPLKDIFVMDGSKRSSKSNAFFTGFGKNKRIALYDTLIEKHTIPELVAVLAHEIGHYKLKHILKGMIISVIHSGVMFFLLSFFLNDNKLFEAFYMQNISVYGGLLFFGLLFTPIELLLGIFLQYDSRRNEFSADKFASATTNNPEAMINALKKLSADNLSHLMPHPFYVFLHYSHPPVLKRIAALRRISN
ncbi:MAG: M48 family metallopeptidase [Ignavibacteriales bacterium]|nr:M48 family metallopeptidase [Ignavibacteriales bacterium]